MDPNLLLRLGKLAFVPSQGQQAPGPDGQPVGLDAGGGPGGPAGPGGAPPAPPGQPGMPPAPPQGAPAGPPGAPPMDPSAGAAPPADPNAAPPADPNQPPADLLAAMGAGAPTEAGPKDPNTAINHDQAKLVMDIVTKTLDAYGKSKKPNGGAKPPGGADPAAGGDPNALPPGPVTGLPGDMSPLSKGGPLKLGG
jgi:hypothetical protein